MLKKIVKFIHKLRIIFLFVIVISFFSYLGANPINISRFVGAKFGSAVGMSTSVVENPFNKLAMQLKQKEDRLKQKETELDSREEILKTTKQNKLVIVLIVGIIILFVLIIFNFYFDYRRKKKD